jgi:hypothetical protein
MPTLFRKSVLEYPQQNRFTVVRLRLSDFPKLVNISDENLSVARSGFTALRQFQG